MNRLTLWLAQGFGAGRIPFAPGTFGSILGLGWFALLLALSSPFGFVVGLLASLGLSVWIGTAAERILAERDPCSVVLDEIVAVPVCFASWIGVACWQSGVWPAAEFFFARDRWPWTLGVLAAFRFFDIAKPWPVRQSQSLPGGWGITADDLLAAAYVNLTVFLVFGITVSWQK